MVPRFTILNSGWIALKVLLGLFITKASALVVVFLTLFEMGVLSVFSCVVVVLVVIVWVSLMLMAE